MTAAWTDVEHGLFLKLYPTGGARAVHLVTGRPIGSIKVRACQLGIKSGVARRKKSRRYPDEHVVKVLEESAWNARAAAAKLGLHTSTVWAAERRLNEQRKAEIRDRNDARRRQRAKAHEALVEAGLAVPGRNTWHPKATCLFDEPKRVVPVPTLSPADEDALASLAA